MRSPIDLAKIEETKSRRSLPDVVISNSRKSLSKTLAPRQQNNGAPLRDAHPLFLPGGVLAKRFALIAINNVE